MGTWASRGLGFGGTRRQFSQGCVDTWSQSARNKKRKAANMREYERSLLIKAAGTVT